MSEWKEGKLEDLCVLQRGHDLPKSEMKSGEYPVAGSNGMIGFHAEFTTKGPGVTIGRSGSIGTAYFYPNDFWAHNTVLYVKDFKNSFPRFVYYFLKTLDFDQFNAGSAVPTLNRNHIHGLPIKYPEFFEQRAIAGVLSSLDDKIDLLHRQNKTLEALAETLWRQWFVKEVNEEWEEKGLDEIANYLNGLPCQKYPPKNPVGRLPVIKIREMRNGFTEATDWATSDVPNEYVIETGDIIFSWSGSLEVVIWGHGKGVLNQHLFKVTSEKHPKWFYYLATKSFLTHFQGIAEDKATTMGHIKRHHLTEATLPVPRDNDFTKYNEVVEPIIDKIINNLHAIRTLTQMRDTLLPKLMSGEVRVNE